MPSTAVNLARSFDGVVPVCGGAEVSARKTLDVVARASWLGLIWWVLIRIRDFKILSFFNLQIFNFFKFFKFRVFKFSSINLGIKL